MNRKSDEFLFYSSGGFDFLEPYLCLLYGEYLGNYINNIQKYFNSDDFNKICAKAHSLQEIPELTEEQIHEQIAFEDEVYKRVDYIVKKHDELVADGTITDEDYFAIAGQLGLAGGNIEWYKTVFPHTVNLFISSLDEQNQLNKKVRDNAQLIKTIVTIMIDGMRDGQALEVNRRKYWSQGYARHYFRGENAYYVTSRPSLLRGLNSNSSRDRNDVNFNETTLESIRIGLLRETEFALWMKQLSFVRQWPLQVYDGAIGQHYGLPTPYMDVTSDFRVALFFACCTYDNGKWRPLHNEEFDERESRRSVADLGGDSRYGVIFCAPTDILSMNAAMKHSCSEITRVNPIGYQPFMRSVNQHGYVIEGNLRYDMYQDICFSKYRFRLTRSLCDWIFKEMNEGELIYGNDPIADISDIVEEIKTMHCFSENAIEEYLKNNSDNQKEDIISYLTMHGYSVKNNLQLCSEKRMKAIEEYWNDNLSDTIRKKKIIRRPMFIIH